MLFRSPTLDRDGGEENAKFENIIEEFSNFCVQMQDLKFDDSIDTFPDILKNYLTYKQAYKSNQEKKASATIGFIPINLNLTMLGLSGMKIYQKFTINQKFLPANYPERIEFLIKTISHKVDQKGWYTTIDSLGYPTEDSLSPAAAPSFSYEIGRAHV